MSKIFTIADGLENLGALRTGGQGSVYKGKRTGAIYTAVKLIPTPIHIENAQDKNYRNFQNEVAKLKKVNEKPNPNVVKMLSWGITESGSFPYIEMEYIEGPDLSELLTPPNEKIFTLKELLKVADQLSCALKHCHKVGVKHGDIKSDNIKYNTHTGNYVLLDFGLAIMSEEQRRTSIRHAGAVEFMAPEQNEGKMLLQTDVYSYGIILYELLSGQVPFPLNNNSDTARNTVMVAHMEDSVPDVLQLRRNNLPKSWNEEKKETEMQVPAWLLEVINRCLQKRPEDRYDSGVELHHAIANGSVSTGINVINALQPEIIALQEENKRLQRVLAERSQPVTTSGVSGAPVSKAFFNSIFALMIVFMLLSGYLLFFKDGFSGRDNAARTDSIAKADTSTQMIERELMEQALQRRRDSLREEEEEQRRVREAAQQAQVDTGTDQNPDTTLAPTEF
ncbi:serine/threonine protein kinase [Mucilaginibacter auburnensis]|uniref:Serine/threonine-protein kinase n=1 Tax=Mucilaginibacter auburnensis TaxID=1457233 RepID=A0A2H9VL37_9SPHI|nr:serine/threonine-protein kinase [Mucilaginibacter auburnensis]PJJ79043.1 serine/threonine-protein kinase [Mucilaginibacter auburnensis]